MVKEDIHIHNLSKVIGKDSETYISKLSLEDRENIRRFINDLLAQGYTAGRVVKYLYILGNISKRLGKPFKKAG